MGVDIAPGYRRINVEFAIAQETIAADFYLPEPERFPRPWPATVTGPGFAGVKEMLIETYASALARRGVACLSIDYRHWGASGGQPRQDLSPDRQVTDLRAGLDYLEQHPDIDRARLGVWGTSMAGGHAVTLAAQDPRVKAAVALMPFLRAPKPTAGSGRLQRALFADRLAAVVGAPPRAVPVFAEREGMFAVMTSDGGWDWMQSVIANAPNYRNRVTLRSLLRVAAYRPDRLAEAIKIPIRLISAKDDSITPAEPIAAFSRRLSAPHDLHEFEGSHFELFGVHLAATAKLCADWFCERL